MQTPNFSEDQYLDAELFNAAATTVSGDFIIQNQSYSVPGVIHGEEMSVGFSGLNATVQLPSPFGVLFQSGVVAQAHGTQTGMDTQTYVVAFSGLIPASGSVVAYLTASYFGIQQNAVQVVGPPPGHPDYNPAFVPYTAYLIDTDSLQLATTTTAPNNTNVFELFRTTLTAAQSSISTFDPSHQVGSYAEPGLQTVLQTTNVILTAANAGVLLKLEPGVVATLPPVTGVASKIYAFSANSAGTASIQTQGGDLILGAANTGVSSILIPAGNFIGIAASHGFWQVIWASASTPTGASGLFFATPTGASGAASLRGIQLSDLPAYTAPGAITGMVPSSIGATGFNLSAGAASDSTNSVIMAVSGITAWSVANGDALNGYQGGATLPNGQTIHVFDIYGPGKTPGYFGSLSENAPTLPSGYTNFRRVWSFLTAASGNQIHANYQGGTAFESAGGSLTFKFSSPLGIINNDGVGDTGTLINMGVPSGINVEPIFRFNNTNDVVIVTSPAEANSAPNTTYGLFDASANSDVDNAAVVSAGPWITDTSGRLRFRDASGTSQVSMNSRGFVDYRRN